MNIGHARRKITPQGDIYLIGYRNLPNRLEPATGIHDDVYANAILFQQGEREVFLFGSVRPNLTRSAVRRTGK